MICSRKEAEEAILNACHQLVSKGLIARTWGNVSARLNEYEFLITPSGRGYDDLTAEELVVVRISDHTYEGTIKPSSEKGMHAELYWRRPECGFIIHTHQTYASAISVEGGDIDLMEQPETIASDEEKALLGNKIPCAAYGLSSTKKLARNVAKAAKTNPESKAILMKHHGAVIMGADAEEAFSAADALEAVCGRLYEKRCGETIPEKTRPDRGIMKADSYYLLAKAPVIMEMSRRGKPVYAYLDDMAQISGYVTKCTTYEAGTLGFLRALGGGSAVLLKNKGAVCVAPNRKEAEAVAMVLEKNCLAANLALKKAYKPVDRASAALERGVYVRKYSKLKDAKA